METMTDTTVKPSKRKQQNLPGVEPAQVDNPAVEAAAVAYVAVRDERMALTKREKELKESLLAACTEHKVERYEYPNEDGEVMVVAFKTKTKVTVRRATRDDDEDESEE